MWQPVGYRAATKFHLNQSIDYCFLDCVDYKMFKKKSNAHHNLPQPKSCLHIACFVEWQLKNTSHRHNLVLAQQKQIKHWLSYLIWSQPCAGGSHKPVQHLYQPAARPGHVSSWGHGCPGTISGRHCCCCSRDEPHTISQQEPLDAYEMKKTVKAILMYNKAELIMWYVSKNNYNTSVFIKCGIKQKVNGHHNQGIANITWVDHFRILHQTVTFDWVELRLDKT